MLEWKVFCSTGDSPEEFVLMFGDTVLVRAEVNDYTRHVIAECGTDITKILAVLYADNPDLIQVGGEEGQYVSRERLLAHAAATYLGRHDAAGSAAH